MKDEGSIVKGEDKVLKVLGRTREGHWEELGRSVRTVVRMM